MKQRECLLRESEATVARRETIVLRKEAMGRNSRKQATKAELSLSVQGLQRRIRETHKARGRSDRHANVHRPHIYLTCSMCVFSKWWSVSR